MTSSLSSFLRKDVCSYGEIAITLQNDIIQTVWFETKISTTTSTTIATTSGEQRC